MGNLQIFGFQALWSPLFLIFVVGLIALYFNVIGYLRSYFKNSAPVETKTKIFFVTSMVLLYVVKGSPIDLLSHIMFSAHMTQMAVLYLVITPLMILGLPDWLLRYVIDNNVIKPIFSFFTKPLIALLVFNGVFSLYHVPLIFDVMKTNTFFHSLATIVIFIASFFMWWPLLNQFPEHQTLTPIKKVGYIFGDGILLTPACALIIFAKAPLYATYTDPQAWVNALALCVSPDMLSNLGLIGPEMFNMLPLVEDQQLGGIVMKVIQELVYGTMLAYIFFQWAKQEREKDDMELQRNEISPRLKV
ncbi:cytochrome c oxidase assembly factor CtaG [Bacillus songklensis]|uniref:Cytochrome c oxidase assembly factor CtaG n=1 Tax=Bacillus songklensis TaxID=1069116 RepID=A0ABV8B1S4_9BACI